jgi:hypothetical protein
MQAWTDDEKSATKGREYHYGGIPPFYHLSGRREKRFKDGGFFTWIRVKSEIFVL